MKSAIRFLPLATLVIGLAACMRDDVATTDTATPTTATPYGEPTVTTGFDVGDIDMGRKIGADNKITDKTDDFAPTDTIYASIHTKGGTAPVQLMARWTSEDGTIVNEETKTVAAGADTDTAFQLSKAGGLAKGKYTVSILADGREVKTKVVTVE